MLYYIFNTHRKTDMLFPNTQEEFNQQIQDAMRKDFGYEPTDEEKKQWLDGLMNLANKMLEAAE